MVTEPLLVFCLNEEPAVTGLKLESRQPNMGNSALAGNRHNFVGEDCTLELGLH